MQTRIQPRTLLLPLLFLLAAPLGGQTSAKVTVRSAAFPGTGIQKPLELYVGEERESPQVTIWGGKFSPEFKLPRMESWRFGHWESSNGEDGKPARVFKELARTIPPDASRVWLVFFESKSDKGPSLRVKAIGADEGALREGGTLVMNLTRETIAYQIGDKRAKVAPGKQASVEPGSKRGQSFPAKFYFSREGSIRPFVATNWFHGARRKQLALVVQPTPEGPPELLTIDDVASRQDNEE